MGSEVELASKETKVERKGNLVIGSYATHKGVNGGKAHIKISEDLSPRQGIPHGSPASPVGPETRQRALKAALDEKPKGRTKGWQKPDKFVKGDSKVGAPKGTSSQAVEGISTCSSARVSKVTNRTTCVTSTGNIGGKRTRNAHETIQATSQDQLTSKR
eukprot:TRINITY_DN7966_c0_g1_i1.p1 TRINITY_DN7966_c0_g1~~TRINITY_DN7966_c0_g1_i1.p1  ORF type:complete len:172 (-),score=16.38 TRINITY_DN7966_c0_g1_i1:62-538(-)